MRVSSVHLHAFRRFSDVTIVDLPATARLIVLAGPNGNGKSSLFDAFVIWRRGRGNMGLPWDPRYYRKDSKTEFMWEELEVKFHGAPGLSEADARRAFHVRTA